jgi:hypothetical protein
MLNSGQRCRHGSRRRAPEVACQRDRWPPRVSTSDADRGTHRRRTAAAGARTVLASATSPWSPDCLAPATPSRITAQLLEPCKLTLDAIARTDAICEPGQADSGRSRFIWSLLARLPCSPSAGAYRSRAPPPFGIDRRPGCGICTERSWLSAGSQSAGGTPASSERSGSFASGRSTPSCVNRAMLSGTLQCSTSLPPASRSTLILVMATCLPVAGMVRNWRSWVPRSV